MAILKSTSDPTIFLYHLSNNWKKDGEKKVFVNLHIALFHFLMKKKVKYRINSKNLIGCGQNDFYIIYIVYTPKNTCLGVKFKSILV